MKIDVKIVNKILANGIQYYIKMTTDHEQVRLISGTEGCLTFKNTISRNSKK